MQQRAIHLTKFVRVRRSATICLLLIAGITLLTRCIDRKAKPVAIADANGNVFAGSQACASCHKNIHDSQLHTAHFLTSSSATEAGIKGSFAEGSNVFSYDYERNVTMERRNDGFYQIEYDNGEEKKARRFDIVVGSATKGQTYLYWQDQRLFELPITYFTALKQWTNSPGYPNRVIFNRPITARCLECHTTFVQKVSAESDPHESFDHDRIIYGVDCEKCHGAAAKHVEFQTQHPTEKIAKFIINPSSFSRQRSLDLCAICHGGRLQKSKPSFSFQSGDTLSNYFAVDTAAPDATNIDVHGNQYGLLRASKCFRMSQMTCTTCHNPHENEAGKKELFSSRCLTCHNPGHDNFCKVNSIPVDSLSRNCIDCHMPVQSSKAIMVLLQGATVPTPATMRSHLIKIYHEGGTKG